MGVSEWTLAPDTLHLNPALQLVETNRRIPAVRTPVPPQDDKTASPMQKTTALNTSAARK